MTHSASTSGGGTEAKAAVSAAAPGQPATPSVLDVDLDRLRAMGAEELLEFAFTTFGRRAAIGTSLQKTGIAMIDLASRLATPWRVFFIDTLLNHQETYDLLKEVERRYGTPVERFRPSGESVEWLYKTFGQHAHYFNRQLCCRTRKAIPLQEALETLDVWISGLRGDQSSHRADTAAKAEIIQTERGRDVLKLNPLLDWTEQQLEAYSREHDLPHNRLYDYVSQYGERYTVIGCVHCHVPVKEGFDKRMGKFPWEQGSKECGIHEKGGGI